MAGSMRWPREQGSSSDEPTENFTSLTVQELASKIEDFFTKIQRNNGEEIWTLKDEAPGWITDRIVRPAHGDMMPDDWKYEFIYQSLSAIANASDDDLDSPELGPDVYNHELLKWLSSHLERIGYVDEAVSEYGGHSDQGIIGDISFGQMREKDEVYFSVLNSLRRISEA